MDGRLVLVGPRELRTGHISARVNELVIVIHGAWQSCWDSMSIGMLISFMHPRSFRNVHRRRQLSERVYVGKAANLY